MRATRCLHSTRRGVLALVVPLVLACAPVLTHAAIPDSDILADSVLELRETANGGAYRSLTVQLVVRSGEAALTADRDGVRTIAVVPVEEALAVWTALRRADLESLPDASGVRLPPDQSRFTVSYRAGETRGAFTAYAVDSLGDPRYRAIVREILHLTDLRAYGKAWRK